MINSSPKSLGYRFPAEWETHRATWLSYPKTNESWPCNIKEVEKAYNEFVKTISRGEEVHINIDNREKELQVSEALYKVGVDLSKIIFHHIITDDCWTRDHGPAFLVDKEGNSAVIDWEFNAWGNKYSSRNDSRVPEQIAAYRKVQRFVPGIVMEGGSIEVNGNGTLLTTSACLFNGNRNPGLSAGQIEQYLRNYYCVNTILWLEEGIAGDDTDGHIDDVARFADAGTLIMAVEEDKGNGNYKPLQRNLELALKFRLSDGSIPTIVELPMPEYQELNGLPLPASYVNFYICNTGVIVPVFNCKNDNKALDILGRVFSVREIIPIDATSVIHGLGSWHCLSQQEAICLSFEQFPFSGGQFPVAVLFPAAEIAFSVSHFR